MLLDVRKSELLNPAGTGRELETELLGRLGGRARLGRRRFLARVRRLRSFGGGLQFESRRQQCRDVVGLDVFEDGGDLVAEVGFLGGRAFESRRQESFEVVEGQCRHHLDKNF